MLRSFLAIVMGFTIKMKHNKYWKTETYLNSMKAKSARYVLSMAIFSYLKSISLKSKTYSERTISD